MSRAHDDDDKGPYRGPSRAAPYALSRLSAPVSLVDAAREIQHADEWIASTTSAQLSVIAEQIRALRAQAEAGVAQARENAELHRAEQTRAIKRRQDRATLLEIAGQLAHGSGTTVSSTRALESTPGIPAPGWVPAPTR